MVDQQGTGADVRAGVVVEAAPEQAFAVFTRRMGAWCRRHDTMKVSSATASVAGAGPNSSAAVMKNVSETETLAEIDATFIENDPVRTASATNNSQANG